MQVVKWVFSVDCERTAFSVGNTKAYMKCYLQISFQNFVYPWSLRHGGMKFCGIYLNLKADLAPSITLTQIKKDVRTSKPRRNLVYPAHQCWSTS